MASNEINNVHQESILTVRISSPPRAYKIVLVSTFVFILTYGIVLNTETALRMLGLDGPNGLTWAIILIVFLAIFPLNTIRKLAGPHELIVNENGIGCVDWAFTLLPWNKIDFVAEGTMETSEKSIPVLNIFLKEPLGKSVLPYHHSFLVRLYHWRRRGNGMEHQPIILDMRGLDKDISDVINFLAVHYPKKVLENHE